MILRRHHQGAPSDTQSDTAPDESGTPSDSKPSTSDAPQPKAAGRSPSRSKKTGKEG